MRALVPFIKEISNQSECPDRALRIDLDQHNWGLEYPYIPETHVYVWHSGDTLFLHYEVSEKFILANVNLDNGKVYQDSCVEFFISFDTNGYYNIETNCIGNILMSHRKSRKENIIYAPQDILSNIVRTPSLGKDSIGLIEYSGIWTLRLSIPIQSFFNHNFDSFSGINSRCNFYKCGDKLPNPHFMSWKLINTPNPDFHRPEYFGDLIFE